MIPLVVALVGSSVNMVKLIGKFNIKEEPQIDLYFSPNFDLLPLFEWKRRKILNLGRQRIDCFSENIEGERKMMIEVPRENNGKPFTHFSQKHSAAFVELTLN